MKLSAWCGAAVAVAALVAGAAAQDQPKWENLDDGVKAAKKNGKPLLLVTLWKRGVCVTCDTWRDRVPEDPAVAKQLDRFEQAEWLYDGLSGKVIPWTKAHGGKSDDPTVQAFVVSPDTNAVVRAGKDDVHSPTAFAKWLKEQVDAWDKAHPPVAPTFAVAEVKAEGEGTDRRVSSPTVAAAKAEGRSVCMYVSRSERKGQDKAQKDEAKASKRFEKGWLDWEAGSRMFESWVLVKIDLADPDDYAFAKQFGADRSPLFLMWHADSDIPEVFDPATFEGPGGFKPKWPKGGKGPKGK